MTEAEVQAAGTPFVTGDGELARRLTEIGVPVTVRTVRALRYGKRIPFGKIRGKCVYRWAEVLNTLERWTSDPRPQRSAERARKVRVL